MANTYDVSQLNSMPLPLQDTDIAGASRGGTTKQTALSNWAAYLSTKIQALWAATGVGVLIGSTGIGYASAVGSGGAVTQITSATTGVTLSTLTGMVTMVSGLSITHGTFTSFVLTNTFIGANDLVVAHVISFTGGSPVVTIQGINGGGSANVLVQNIHGSTNTSALVIGFAIIKGAVS